MSSPYAIKIHCDGAMSYDRNQTGGNGFIIEFPESIIVEPILGSIRNDGQGIHRLELISLLEAMEALLAFDKKNPKLLKSASGVELYTDRFKATDDGLTNPHRIREWRKNGWRNYEGKPIKDKYILDKIDKTRIKVGQAVGGAVTISYEREKNNKIADKLSKAGKSTGVRGRNLILKKNKKITKRIYQGPVVDYSQIKAGETLEVRLYASELVGDEYEISFEICSGKFGGQVIKAYVDIVQEQKLHRTYRYEMNVGRVYRHHISVASITEIEHSTEV